MEEQPLWPAGWVRAALATAVLAALERGELHGYGIAVALVERGFGRPKGGSLYPLLGQLEESGAVTARWEQGERGPGRKIYALTDAGRTRLREERTSWRALVDGLEER